jgi:hypothetical protein
MVARISADGNSKEAFPHTLRKGPPLEQQETLSPPPFCRATFGDPLFNHVSSPEGKTAKFNSAW